MARKFTASKTQLRPDPRFGSKLVSKFVNCLMHDGKKSVAQRVFYDAMVLIEQRLSNENPLQPRMTSLIGRCADGPDPDWCSAGVVATSTALDWRCAPVEPPVS